jgi:hypothetical protein
MSVPKLKPLTVDPMPPLGVNRSEWEEFQAYKAAQQAQQSQGPTNGQVLMTTLAVIGGIKMFDHALKNWRI